MQNLLLGSKAISVLIKHAHESILDACMVDCIDVGFFLWLVKVLVYIY